MSNRRVFASIEEFRREAKGKESLDFDPTIRASFDTEIKAGDGESRTMTFTISSDAVDRMGDTIAVSGWQLENFRKNPVVLWAHDSTMLPCAKAPKVWIESGKLKADAEFTPLGMARFNDTVFDMLKAGFLNATSVGFAPLKYAFTDDPQRRYGIDFLEQELLEYSIVPIPANAEALVEARGLGIDLEPLRGWAEKILDGEGVGVWIPRQLLEDTFKAAKTPRSVRQQFLTPVPDLAAAKTTPDPAAPESLDWAKGVLEAHGLVPVERDRIERVERAAKAQRLARKRQRDIDVIRARSA